MSIIKPRQEIIHDIADGACHKLEEKGTSTGSRKRAEKDKLPSLREWWEKTHKTTTKY